MANVLESRKILTLLILQMTARNIYKMSDDLNMLSQRNLAHFERWWNPPFHREKRVKPNHNPCSGVVCGVTF